MNRLQRAAVLLKLLDALRSRGSWCGETHVQKSVFALQELFGVPLEYRFVLYRHGPYSFELADEITALRADMLLAVQPREPYGPSLVAGDSAERFLENFQRTTASYSPAIEFVVERFGRCTVVELERLATALYVTHEEKATTPSARAARLRELKPHIQPEDAERAVAEVAAILRDVASRAN
jgi:uncharacterized protein YwgA